MPDLTPVEEHGGRWFKRDDLNRHPSGVNGGKWRQVSPGGFQCGPLLNGS